MNLSILLPGSLDYKVALELQERLLLMRQQDEIEDTLVLLEHPPVLTLGRRGEYGNILLPLDILENQGVKVYEVSRGGDVTYHGPGQIVGYPIINLCNIEKDIKQYVYKIEEVIIRLLFNELGIQSYRKEKKYTGIWVGEEKITAIGIAVKKWVTMHGFAFNVNTNLDHFKWITPCGIADKSVTSVQKILGRELDIHKMNDLVIKYFCEVFNAQYVIRDWMDFICTK